MPDYPKSMPVAHLTKRVSAKGHEYFSGRWGDIRIALLKDRDPDNEGREIWTLTLQPGDTALWHPGRGGGGRPAKDSESPQDAQEGKTATSGHKSSSTRPRGGYGAHGTRSGRMRPAGTALKAAMASQAPHGRVG